MSKKSFFQLVKILVFLSIGVLSIWWFLGKLTTDEKKEIWDAFGRANYWWLVLTMGIGFVAHFIRALRWNLIIEPLGYKPKVIDTFAAVAIGYLGNFIIPRFGEVARCVTLRKYSGASFSALFGTVIVERIFDMLAFLILFFLGLYFFIKQLTNFASGFLYEFLQSFTPEKILLIAALFLAFIFVLVLLWAFRKRLTKVKLFEKVFSLLSKFKEGLLSMLKMKHWGMFVMYTVLMWFCYFLMTYLCFYALEETSQLPLDAGFAALVFGTVGIIVVQGGIGVYPFIVSETLVLYGISSTYGYASGWIIWLSQTIILLIIGMWAFAHLTFKKGFSFNEIRKHQEKNTD